MRRRDAHRTLLVTLGRRPKGPVFVSSVVSAAVHAAALALAVLITVRTVPTPQVLRIAFVAGGGTGDAAGGAAGGGAPAAPPEEAMTVAPPPAAAPAPVAAVKPQPQAIRRPAAPPRMVRAARPPTLAAAVADVAKESAAMVHELAGLAEGSSEGTGSGTGMGGGDGSGAGTGGGTGGGTGTGSGAGSGDSRARCVYCPEPRYPIVARQRGWQGIVRVGLAVGSDGHVEDASLWQSSGYSALDDAAVAVALRSRFTPPQAEGRPTPLRGHIEYRFQLSRAP